MRGQTHRAVLRSRLQAALRSAPTDAERRLWMYLRGRQLLGCKFRRQHPYESFILDFVCLERHVVIEVDGAQHAGSEADATRDAFLRHAGFRVLRFWNHDVLGRTEAVLESIVAALEHSRHDSRIDTSNHPHPDPPLEGEGEQPRGE